MINLNINRIISQQNIHRVLRIYQTSCKKFLAAMDECFPSIYLRSAQGRNWQALLKIWEPAVDTISEFTWKG